MDNIKNVITPVTSLIDVEELGLVESAKVQLRSLNLGELILISDDFTKHNRLNQIGEVRLDKIREQIIESKEYKEIQRISKEL